jgi:ABC-2 type transport system permease protein
MPLRYYLIIVRGIFLKGSGIELLWPQLWPLLVIGTVVVSFSIARFRKQLD